MYNEYLINKMVDSKIKEYAKYCKKYGSNLDKLESIQRNIELHCEEKIKSKQFQYLHECTEIQDSNYLIQNRFDYYFKVGNFYNWIRGNDNFKKLL
jgi:vacuolar-type H+-ATPase catalytic subunit A/Vma1